MKHRLIAALAVMLFASSAPLFSQTDQDAFLLEWKIPQMDTLRYQTIMKNVSIEDETTGDTAQSPLAAMLANALSSFMNMSYETVLFANAKNNKHVDIEMWTIFETTENGKNLMSGFLEKASETASQDESELPEEQSAEDNMARTLINKALTSMNKTINLRGRISSTGEILSSYYKGGQKNLIGILFQLPGKPVKVGDKWSVDANMLEMDQNFYCDSVYRHNEVYLDQIIEKDGDKIAVIKYVLDDYVLGDYEIPFGDLLGMNNKDEKMYMQMTYRATGHFSINKGRWVNYEGETLTSTNMALLGGKYKTVYMLQE